MMLVTVFLLSLATASTAGASIGWKNECPFSHRKVQDPIVYPRQRHAGHRHDFYGNETTNGFSTYRTLIRATTTCETSADTSAYWSPTLYYDGEKVTAVGAVFYYRSITSDPRAVRPFPRNLRIIAGDAHATGDQPHHLSYWGCDEGSSSPNPIDCGTGTDVIAHVNFPDCWDGKRKDSKDHKSHMAYSVSTSEGRVCPASHPVPVPRLIFRLQWPVSDGTKVSLASGEYFTLHADFLNSWDQGALRTLVRRCIRANKDCGTDPTF